MTAERVSPDKSTERRLRRWSGVLDSARLYAAVIAGGIIGSLARWAVALAVPADAGAFPWPTFLANATGCFVIGFYAALTGPNGRLFADARTRQFIMTGICGGYTTFSGFSLEIIRFVIGSDLRAAAFYLVVSLVSWLGAVWLGDVAAEWINR